MASGNLTAPQLRALLDILVHYETYREVQSFQTPEGIETYGWPFDRDGKDKPAKPHSLSSSPLLQLLLTRLLLGAPAVRDLSPEFWPAKFKGIMKQFGNADLSDSYDKGTLGTRKRLATAASVVHEAATRGLLSGVSHNAPLDLHRPYDTKKADDLRRAWRDCICQLVYGELIDEIFDQLTQTEDLEAHSPALEGAVEYAILYIATFLHQTFILSAEGPYLLKIIENVHKLVPYTVIGQTLRVGNAASMINAMSRLFLSKVSVGALSNWIGLTSNAADGMNLMQRIVSLVLEWDTTDFRKAVDKIKQNKGSISNEHITAIERHLAAKPDERESARQRSIQEQESIIIAIFEAENKQLVKPLTDLQHTSCLEYYAARLAIRDREQITDVLCNSTPDQTTAIVYESLGALDPMIRTVHKNVDLRKHLSAMEGFLTDFIKTTKPKTQESGLRINAPSVKDFVELLQRNRHLLWEYLHDFCSGCPDLRDTWRNWMKDAIKVFRQKPHAEPQDRVTSADRESQTADAGDMGPKLQVAFDKLSDAQKKSVLESIDAHSKYLNTLGELSRAKMQKIIDNVNGKSRDDTGNMSGPGIYASRWQSLLDETLITPSVPKGPPRCGKDIKSLRSMRNPDNQPNSDTFNSNTTILARQESPGPAPPDVSVVVEALGPQFRRMVAEISLDSLPNEREK
ncbi:hypothetical protein HD806DRAFT_528817 [Xylariaceae sp. AK1471]|nr:hypothetical protein HD806DRAFT_528817 [Xylariaceae sp. AK1471]